MSRTFARVAGLSVPTGAGGWAAGASSVDLTPRLDLPLAGFGPIDNGRARGFVGRLRGTCLALDDGAGGAVALIAVDLHAGTRWLVERLAELLTTGEGPGGTVVPVVPLGVERLFVAGSHTHAGPARIYGNRYFDDRAGTAFSEAHPGFDPETSEWLALQLARGVRQAWAAREPARVHHGVALADGAVIQRALGPFLANPEAAAPTDALWRSLTGGRVRAALPEFTRARERVLATDSRIQAVVARRASGAPIGVFASLGAHTTVSPRDNRLWSPDAFGVAAGLARRSLGAPVGLVGGSVGDCNLTIPPDLVDEVAKRVGRKVTRFHGDPWSLYVDRLLRWRTPTLGPGYDERERPEYVEVESVIGRRLGEVLLAAVADAVAAPALAARVSCGLDEVPVAGASVDLPVARRTPVDRAERVARGLDPHGPPGPVSLAARPEVGKPALGAAEGGQHLFSALFPTSAVAPHPDIAQRPKRTAALAGDIEPGDALPVRLVRIGALSLVGLPTECTTMLSHRIAQVVGSPCLLASPCGDYAGYATTAEEYDQQEYEGASTLWGRYTGVWLESRVAALAAGSAPAPASQVVLGAVVRRQLHTSAPPSVARLPAAGGSARLLPPRALPGGRVLLAGRWAQPGPLVVGQRVGESAWIVVQTAPDAAGPYTDLEVDGARVDDTAFPALIERRVRAGHQQWRYAVELPAAALAGRWVRVRFVGPPDVMGPGVPASAGRRL